VIFIAAAALFAWVQNRQIEPVESTDESREFSQTSFIIFNKS